MREYIGKVFGDYTVGDVRKHKGTTCFVGVCSCGEFVAKPCGALLSAGGYSCCHWYNKVLNKPSGKLREHLRSLHRNMMQRCHNPSNKGYVDYGARGIEVCERWHSFPLFAKDMGEYYQKGLSIDRKDSNGDYTPENCCWSTMADQSRNKTIYKNNKSGFMGVVFNKKQQAWRAIYRNYYEKKDHVRSFRVKKYGDWWAKSLAVAYRELMIDSLRSIGIYYGESHGAQKKVLIEDSVSK